MNTPSKEALDAAENVQDYWGFPRRATIDIATIIDRHFEPLRKRLAEMESMLASEKATRNAIIAKGQQAEARNAELEATCAELVTDGNAVTLAANLAKQSARVAELAGALLELSDAMHRYEADVSCEVETIPSAHCEMMRRVSDALASHDAGEPVVKDSFTAEPAKHPDSDRLDWLENGLAMLLIGEDETIREAIDRARKEVKP